MVLYNWRGKLWTIIWGRKIIFYSDPFAGIFGNGIFL